MRISVIVPVYNGGNAFRQCLSSIVAAGPPHELIVVADGDTDSSRHVATEYGTRLLTFDQSHGPAFARNQGAQAATGDVLFFVDSDVCLHADSLQQVARSLTDDSIAAVIGSYDDKPAAPQFIAQYKNLAHHYVHQNANEDAHTFWGACGAVRRDLFLELEGFDALRYTRPSIEDIEFGYRLRAAGYRIRLNKALYVTHLKRWTLLSLLRTDIFDRALPWSRLILENQVMADDLNTDLKSRLSILLIFGLSGTVFAGILHPGFFILAISLAAALVYFNQPFYAFFVAKRGWRFAIGAMLLHWLYFLYSGLAFGFSLGHHIISKLINSLIFRREATHS